MRGARRAIAAGGAALALATVTLVHRFGRSGSGLASVPARASAAADAAADAAAPPVALRVDPGTPPARAAALRARLGAAAVLPAVPGPEPAVLQALGAYSAGELGAFARFERLTDRPAPPALLELVRLRRAGADGDELTVEASRLFAGDPLGRAAALDGLREAGR
jgi:hypothetical protein